MRHSILSIVVISTVSVLSVASCSGGDVAVGKTNQQLTTRKDGSPTGNGQTCSWENTSLYDGNASSAGSAANASYDVGADFKSLDGCNDCTCTDRGIMCTVRACNGGGGDGQACTDDARQCPDGSYVGRTGPKCEFVCPTPNACTMDAFRCPDGTEVGRSGPKCEFVCPTPRACATDAKLCPDGRYVGRGGPNCEFNPCP